MNGDGQAPLDRTFGLYKAILKKQKKRKWDDDSNFRRMRAFLS
jgi:hypothetical protein